jgi:hypothetical protein
VRRWGQWKERGSGPSEKERNRLGEQRAHPSKVAPYAGATADHGRVSLRPKRAGKEDREEQ